MDDNIDMQRKEFKRVTVYHGLPVSRFPQDGYWEGAYIEPETRTAWKVWQAAIRCLEGNGNG